MPSSGTWANASALSSWQDNIRLTSNSLAAGTVVTISGKYSLHDIISYSFVPDVNHGPSEYPVLVQSGLDINILSGGSYSWGLRSSVDYGRGTGEHYQSIMFSFQAAIGDTLIISNGLMGASGAHLGTARYSEMAGLDATHTSLFGLFGDNTNVSFVSDSGTDYVIPESGSVPEPSSHLMLITGIVLMNVGARSRRIK